ncbi:hypothetical protein Y032_0078g1175 [Ancylostoma ceylanicum]|uniref:Methyltransferase type 11 domain-containing protein n=1 Tax=Ancylostoma ceylanicum TaxID=53326 RepID=A0A016TTL1_9BILA|nr:hypothetical protein Y032_0078g1175 [Ancylostoma ceylanicum]
MVSCALQHGIPEHFCRRDTFFTAKGIVTYVEIEQNVFLPNNYRIMEPTFPFPKLDFVSKPSCAEIFEDWLNITKRPIPAKPPKEVKESDKDAFLLNGYSFLYEYKYSNEKAARAQVVWNEIAKMMWKPRKYVGGYGNEGLAVYYAMRDYRLENMTGFVIGSREPWIEVLALRSGASKVYTVEYRATRVLGTDRIEYMHPIDFAEKWKENVEKFDFAITFSSIEHSGLGRYGDSIDPIGDIREVQKVMCLLKKGGFFFVGLPRGADAIKYNLHRIYGRMRLSMIMAGYKWVAMYRGDSPYPQCPRREDYEVVHKLQHEIHVLRKL